MKIAVILIMVPKNDSFHVAQ